MDLPETEFDTFILIENKVATRWGISCIKGISFLFCWNWSFERKFRKFVTFEKNLKKEFDHQYEKRIYLAQIEFGKLGKLLHDLIMTFGQLLENLGELFRICNMAQNWWPIIDGEIV